MRLRASCAVQEKLGFWRFDLQPACRVQIIVAKVKHSEALIFIRLSNILRRPVSYGCLLEYRVFFVWVQGSGVRDQDSVATVGL